MSGGTMSEEQVLPEFIATLKAAAEKATPGPYSPSPAACGALMKVRGGLGKNIADLRYTNGLADTLYFSLASPENILKLIASLAQSEAERERLQGELRQSQKCLDEIPSAMKLYGLYIRGTPNSIIQVSDAFKKLEALAAELARERERNQALRATNERLTSAIYWALGYEEFRQRGPKEGAYWWRTELRSRALLADKAEPAPVVTGEK